MSAPKTRTCRKCNKPQPLENFPIYVLSKGGKKFFKSRRWDCRRCRSDARLKHKRKQTRSNPELWQLKRQDYQRQRYYGITPAKYWEMVAAQDFRCAICQKDPGYDLVVDHDHKTKEVRGLICEPCNLMLGHAGDQPYVLLEGAAYLKGFQARKFSPVSEKHS